jgi:hypothetical protein
VPQTFSLQWSSFPIIVAGCHATSSAGKAVGTKSAASVGRSATKSLLRATNPPPGRGRSGRRRRGMRQGSSAQRHEGASEGLGSINCLGLICLSIPGPSSTWKTS